MEALRTVADWPVGRAAVGVARIEAGAWPSAAANRRPSVVATEGDTEGSFEWASVTKLATALAVLVAVEEGTVELDEPAGPPGATVRHLLAHASGLGPEPGPPVAPPGTVRVYSNEGYAVLAAHLEERAGLPFADYLTAGVLDPLGMDAVLQPATPHGAAAGLSGRLGDLLALGSELLAPTVVAEDTLREATSVQFPKLPGVLPGFGRFDPCDWGLGPEIRGAKRPHWTGAANSPATFGHFGRSGSFLWVDPAVGVCTAGLADRPFGPWAARRWPALADSVLEEVARPDMSPA